MSEKTVRLERGVIGMIYPVGSIYISANSTSPAELFGGTWEQIKDRFLLAAGDSYKVGDTGGEAQHTLTVDEMPAHEHSQRLEWSNVTGYGLNTAVVNPSANALVDAGIATGSTGNSKPHNNMPPYLAVYAWKRIA